MITVRGSGAIEKYELGYDNEGLYTLDIKKNNSKTTTWYSVNKHQIRNIKENSQIYLKSLMDNLKK